MSSFVLTITIVLPAVEAGFYAFHFLIFLLMVCQRKKVFNGPFYDIYRILLGADILYWLTYIFCLRFPAWGIFIDIYKNSYVMGFIYSYLASYLSVLQFVGQSVLSFNRFTVLWFTTRHKRIWKRQWYTVFILFVPFLHICYRLHVPSYYIFKDNGQVSLTLSDPVLKAFVVQANFYIYIVSTLVEGFFAVLSLLKYYTLGKTESSQIKKQEIRLLLISCIIFVAQLLRSSYSYFRPNFETNDQLKEILAEIVPFTADLCAWSRSISLILLSLTARKAFYYFYFNQENDSIFTSSVQTVHPANKKNQWM